MLVVAWAIVLLTTPFFVYAQDSNLDLYSESSGITSRLRDRMPLFEFGACSQFLVPYGTSEKNLTESAKRAGLLFASKSDLPQVPGAYMLAFIDPENIHDAQGNFITRNVIYVFAFHPSVKYFSYSVRITCTSPYYSEYAISSICDNIDAIGGSSGVRQTGSSIVACQDINTDGYKRVRMFSLLKDPQEPSFTFTAMDFSAIEQITKHKTKK